MANQRVINALSKLLADTYTLYTKSHSYHWNVQGPMFTTLHTLFEVQYTELTVAIDEIAERIRALGSPAPGSFSQFAAIADVKEDTGVPKATVMINNLARDQDIVVASARAVIDAAEGDSDHATTDLGVRRMDVHQKNAWMLRSHLEH